MKEKTLWSGRFSQAPSSISQEISESISYDKNLFEQDIAASKAHAQMLAHCGIITKEQAENILRGLDLVLQELRDGALPFRFELEDIHTHIENRLCELIGDDGKRLHTARSRNDQVAVDTHLFLLEQAREQRMLLIDFLKELLLQAKRHKDFLWAGYTHTQIAQPVLLAHWILSYFWPFRRDLDLLDFVITEADRSPLGAAAMGGANYPIDRNYSASLLGFSRIYENSMDAVANRDYQLNYHYFATRLALHSSRLCEDLILYSTAEFGYVKMGEAVTTGSSIMPQKKNPDIAELLRGKTGRAIGNFMALINNIKGLPSTYNRDLQEDKVYLMDNMTQVRQVILGLHEIIKNTTFLQNKIHHSLEQGFAQATDIADYLVTEYGLPFRQAHEHSAALVVFCERHNKTLKDLTSGDVHTVWQGQFTLPHELLSLQQSPQRRQGEGSTNPSQVEKQLALAETSLQSKGQSKEQNKGAL